MRYLVAIPCYNCEKQIVRVLDSLHSSFHNSIDIALIDNGSEDNTRDVILKYLESHSHHNMSLYQNVENYGLGGTHKVAFDLAIKNQYEFLIILHGDDQADVSDISQLIDSYSECGHSVLGSRFSSGSVLSGYQQSRIYGNLFLNKIFSIVLRRKIVDLGSGLNLFSVDAISKVDWDELSDHFNFNVDLLLAFIKNKIQFKYHPIHWSELDQVSNARNFQVASSMIKSLFYWFLGLSSNTNKRQKYPTNLIHSNH